MEEKQYQSIVQVADVLGGLDVEKMMEKYMGERATSIGFPSVRPEETAEGRRQILSETGAFITVEQKHHLKGRGD